MRLLDLTLDTVEENVALDEALLVEAEEAQRPVETLRLWESQQKAVVVGRSSRVYDEVDVEACKSAGVPVLRRGSGGAAVVLGKGCLMYGVILSMELRPELRSISDAHEFVLGKMTRALAALCPDVSYNGTSDMTVGNRKFSGNSLRCKRDFLLYHGTILYAFELSTISRLLKTAPRQPAYREGREHFEFVANLPSTATLIRQAILAEWNITTVAEAWPEPTMRDLIRTKYSQHAWNFSR